MTAEKSAASGCQTRTTVVYLLSTGSCIPQMNEPTHRQTARPENRGMRLSFGDATVPPSGRAFRLRVGGTRRRSPKGVAV